MSTVNIPDNTPNITPGVLNDQICGGKQADGSYLNKFPQYCCDPNNKHKNTYQCKQYINRKVKNINKDTGTLFGTWNMNGKIWSSIAEDKNKLVDTWAELVLFKYKMPLQTLMQGTSLFHDMTKQELQNITQRIQDRTSAYIERTQGVKIKPKDITAEDMNEFFKTSAKDLEMFSGEVRMQMEADAYNARSLAEEYSEAQANNKLINNPVTNLIHHIVGGFMFANMVLQASSADNIEGAAIGGALAGMGSIKQALLGAGTSVALYELGVGKDISKLQKFKSTILNKKTIDYLGNLYKGSYAMNHRAAALFKPKDTNADWGNLQDEQLDWPLELNLDSELGAYFDCSKISTNDCKNGHILGNYCTPCGKTENCKCKYNPNNSKQDYKLLHKQYYYEYLNNLKYNSNGQLINPTLSLNDLGFLTTLFVLPTNTQSIEYTKWDLFLKKYSKFIFFVIVCICIFCYILKNLILKKNI